MRALLVVNGFATTTSPQVQSVISAALEKNLDLTVVNTSSKNHAIELGKTAQVNGFDLVIGFGGDGTLNEIANGLLVNGPNPDGPKLAGIPGGNANVFLRNLGFQNDPIAATAELMEKIKANSTRKIGMGRIGYGSEIRWFLFNGGFGLDARVVARMEERRYQGKLASDLTYGILTLRELFTEIRKVKPNIVITDQNKVSYKPVQFALMVNFSPWTYAGNFAISPMARKADTSSIDIFAIYNLTLSNTARLIKELISSKGLQSNSRTLVLESQKSLEVSAYEPTWAQVDGEALALVTSARIEHFADCLTVIA